MLYIPSLIHSDQSGFVPEREARDNTQRVLSAIHLAQEKNIPFILLSADAEKAFDRVSWGFILGPYRSRD